MMYQRAMLLFHTPDQARPAARLSSHWTIAPKKVSMPKKKSPSSVVMMTTITPVITVSRPVGYTIFDASVFT